MEAEKMSGKSVAEPVSEFWLEHCVLDEMSARKSPWMITARKIKSPSRRKTGLDSEIYSRSSVVQQISLYSKFLSFDYMTPPMRNARETIRTPAILFIFSVFPILFLSYDHRMLICVINPL